MKILLCNPQNTQGTKHSRKGMYVPLGMLSIATYLKDRMKDQVKIDICDEDVEYADTDAFKSYDLVGLYSTTFNYEQAIKYAKIAKDFGCITLVGGPHPTVLAANILKNQDCFDFVVRFEGEIPIFKIVESLLNGTSQDLDVLGHIPNIAYKRNGKVFVSDKFYENDLTQMPIPDRSLIDFDLYTNNYWAVYPEKKSIYPGSIFSSKGCSWRDKSGGCIFCARLEKGVRFRDPSQIWQEIEMLKDSYGVNSIWDIADDNLNNKEWFIDFVNKRPDSCKNLDFFVYSRVGCIKPWAMDYFHKLNVKEVFLGVESGDNRLLKKSFKGQTRKIAYQALETLKENNIKYYPSFVLALPGENLESLNNTFSLCKDIAALGGLERMSATILKPIPGSPAYNMYLSETPEGKKAVDNDVVDLAFLEKYWIDQFTNVRVEVIEEYRRKINQLMSKYHVFGSSINDKS